MQDFGELIKKLNEEKEYRPVGVAILYREKNEREFLITQSPKALEVWSCLQGGIKTGETLEENLIREVGEEAGINFKKEVVDVKLAYHYEKLDFDASRKKNKRGFTKGKAYFFNLGKYVGDGNLNLQKNEVANAKWMNYEKALEYFSTNKPGKAALSKLGLDKAIEILEGCGG